jgi:hypothetical protein
VTESFRSAVAVDNNRAATRQVLSVIPLLVAMSDTPATLRFRPVVAWGNDT